MPLFLCVCCTSLTKTLEKGEIARDEQFLPFPNSVFYPLKNFLPCSSNSKLLSANSFRLEESKNLLFGKRLTLHHTITTFNDPDREALLKTLWEKEKMLVTSISSFSHNVLQPSKKQTSNFQSHFVLSSAHAFNLDQSKILLNPHDIPKRMKYTQFKMLNQLSLFRLMPFSRNLT